MNQEATQTQRNNLRKDALEQRRLMPQPYRLQKSALICQRLLQSLDLTLGITGKPAADCVVGVYSAFPEEVQLDDFIQGVFARGARIAFPCMVSDAWSVVKKGCDQTMEMREVNAEDYRSKNAPFLQNPLKTYTHDSADLAAYPYVSAYELDMLVVPIVAFDRNHNRLGYGGGNYDRYLSQYIDHMSATTNGEAYAAQSQGAGSKSVYNAASVLSCRIVGVAFEEQGVPSIPTEDHDIALPIIAL